MANLKKQQDENLENINETKDNIEVEQLKNTVNELQEQLLKNNQLIEQLMKSQIKEVDNKPQDMEIKNENKIRTRNIDMNRQITIIHLEDRAPGLYTYFKSSNQEYYFSYFGQTWDMLYSEFQDLFAKNRILFEQNILTLSSEDDDVAQMPQYNLKNKNVLQAHHLNNLVNLNDEELKHIYNSVCDTHKSLIIRKWTQGFYEYLQKNPNSNATYANYQKIHLLNELSNHALENILQDIEDKRRKGISI